jgi:sec-independent protein translocase protein TatA
MFGIGMQELMIIFVVALLVLGPAKLPSVARSIGKGLRELRKASDDLRGAIMFEDEDLPQRKVAKPPAALEESPIIQGSLAAGPVENAAPGGDDFVVRPAGEGIARGALREAEQEGPLPEDGEVKELLEETKQRSAAAAAPSAPGEDGVW